MTRRRILLTSIVCCFLLFVPGLTAQTLRVINTDGRSTTLTTAQIAN
jgi:hypothetical protein